MSDTYKYGLYAPNGDLYIRGTGSLTCIASDDELVSTSLHQGIYANNLHIEGATLKGSVGATSGSSSLYNGYGVRVTSLTMQNGNLEGICSTVYYGYGIYVEGTMNCESSVIAGTSGGRLYSYGIYAEGAVNCNDSTICVTTGKTSKRNWALYFAASSTVDLLIRNSEVYATSGQVPASSGSTVGIVVSSNCVLQVENSQINAEASSYYTTSSSITSSSTGVSGSIELISGTITAKGMKKSFGATPTLPETDYWWREATSGSYLKNNFETPVSTYCEITTETQEQVADSYIILDANEGAFVDGSVQKRILVSNGQLANSELLEEPERTDYYFRGWYDAASNGTQVDLTNAEVLQGTTVYAKWEATYRPTTFYIGSTQITSAGYWKNDGAGALTTEGASETDYNVYYDGVNGLVLKDLNITTCYTNATTHYGIYAAIGNSVGNLDIEIIGENIIDVSSSSFSSLTNSKGIYVGKLNLFGGGKLTVKSGKANTNSYAIECKNRAFSANNVELYCVAGNGTTYSYGIKATTISVTDSIVNVETTTGATNRYGIYGYPITFENSEINCDSCGTYGIYAVSDDVIIKNSTVSSRSNVTAVDGANLSISNSDVTLQGTTKSMNLTGQLDYVSGHLTASGSRTATVNVTAPEYWWRTANDDLFVKNSYLSSNTAYLELTTTQPANVAKATIIFDAGERTFTDDTSVKMFNLEDGYITESQIPTLDTYAGYFFNYWQTEDGTEVDFTQEFSGTITVTPKFTQPSVLLVNTDISEGGYWLNDGNGGITKEGASENNYNLYYDGAGNMTLNGLVITEGTNYLRAQYTSGHYGLYSATSLAITVIGENKIDISEEVVYVATYGIYSTGNLTILGDGSLHIFAKTASSYTGANSYGIYANGAVTVTNTNLEVICESSSSSYYGYGIYGTTTLTLMASDVIAKGSYGVYTKSGTTLNENAKLYAISAGNRNYESIYGSIAINVGTVIAERTSTGKCFSSTPTFSTDYWWRNQNQGGYLLNAYVSENSHYEELTTEEPAEVALTYVTLNADGGTIDGASSKTVFTNGDGEITKEIFDTDPIYWDYYLDGWFTETEYINEVDLYNTTFFEPTTLYAKWNAIEVTIGEVNVSDGGYWMNDGSGGLTQEGASESNYNVYYDGEANLTLRDLNITGQYENVSYKATLNFRVPITVTLIGENVIRTTTGSGICATKDTVFQGMGTLNCVDLKSFSGSSSRSFYFIEGATIDGAKLYVDGTHQYGVYASSLTVKNNGVLEAHSGDANTSSYTKSYGIYVENTLELSDGVIKGVGGDAYYSSDHTYSYGVYAKQIIVSGGELEGVAGKVYRPEKLSSSPYYCSIGICAITSIDISGGEVIGIGNDVNSLNSYAWTYGISLGSGGTMNVTGGKVTGQCGTVNTNVSTTRQYGLYIYSVTFNMTGGELILEKGMSKAPSTLPEEYRWRTTKTGEFTSSADTAYTYSANDYLQIISENLVSEKTVTLYSATTDETLSVSQVSGGGIYNVGNTVQIQAESLENYMFKGWYAAEFNENNECIGYDANTKVSDTITYSFEIAENVNYVAVYEKITTKVMGYTLSLNGAIAANIHMIFTQDVLDDDTAYIRITFADGEIHDMKISDATLRDVNGTQCYVFTCGVQAPEMNDYFNIELITKNGSILMDTYSVKEYADYILSHTEDADDYAKAAPLVKAMLNYGGYSQKQFAHNTDALANEGLYTTSTDPVLVGTVPTLYAHAFTAPTTNVGVKYYGTSLLLNSETTIRHYFTITEGEDIDVIREKYEFKLEDGTVLTPVMRGGMIYVDIKDVNAAELDVLYKVTVTNTETAESFTFSYSALSYAKYVLEYALAGTNLVNVIKAMYFYNDAANTYFG